VQISFPAKEGVAERLFPKHRVIWWGLLVFAAVGLLSHADGQAPLFSVALPVDHLPTSVLFLFGVALACEFIDSSLGMGYGTALTPLLLVMGYEPMQVVPCVLLSELLTGVAAGLMHQKDGNVDFLRDRVARQTVVMLSLLSLVGAVSATVLAVSLPGNWLKVAIGLIIVGASTLVLLTSKSGLRYRGRNIILLGVVAAFNKGLSGGGYGPLTTSGQILAGVPAKNAVAITSFAEAVTCLFGLCGYLWYRPIDLSLAVPLALGALLSVPMATLTIRLFPEQFMRLLVGGMTFLLGCLTLIKACL